MSKALRRLGRAVPQQPGKLCPLKPLTLTLSQGAHVSEARCGGLGVPSSSSPANSGPNSLAADVKVESSVDRLSKMKMRLVMLNRPTPKKRDTAAGCPPSMPVNRKDGTLRSRWILWFRFTYVWLVSW